MNIGCVVHNFFPYFYTGTERYILNVSKQLQRMGHKVTVITYGLKDEEPFESYHGVLRRDYEYEGVPVAAFRHVVIPDEIHYRLFFPDMEYALTEYFQEAGLDLIQVAHPMRVGGPSLSAAKSLKIPGVLTLTDFWLPCPRGRLYQPDFSICRGPEGGNRCMAACNTPVSVLRRYQEARQVFFDLADVLIAPSRMLIGVFRQIHWNRPITMVRHGYLYERVPPPRPSARQAGPVRLGYLGAVSHVKGVDYLIDCFKQVSGSNITLDIYGGHLYEGEWYESLMRRAADDARIRFRGKYEISDLPEILENVDVVVVPSNTLESYGLVVIESMAYHTPVITSNVVGSAYEFIEHGVNGHIFNLDTPATLIQVLEALAREPEIVDRWRDAIKPPPRIEEEVFTLETIYSGLRAHA